MKQLVKALSLVTLVVFSSSGIAGGMGATTPYYINVGLGFTKSSSDDTHQVNNGSGFPGTASYDLYSMSSIQKSPGLMIEAGQRWETAKEWLTAYSLGLRYQHIFNQTVKGQVNQYMLPGFINYDYRFHLSNDNLQVMGKIDLFNFHQFMPYASAGLGMVINHTSGYTELPLSVTPRVSPGFSSTNEAHFIYSLGTGVDFVHQDAMVSVGYEYQQLGQVVTGSGAGSWSGQQLRFSNLSSHNVLLQLGLLFDR